MRTVPVVGHLAPSCLFTRWTTLNKSSLFKNILPSNLLRTKEWSYLMSYLIKVEIVFTIAVKITPCKPQCSSPLWPAVKLAPNVLLWTPPLNSWEAGVWRRPMTTHFIGCPRFSCVKEPIGFLVPSPIGLTVKAGKIFVGVLAERISREILRQFWTAVLKCCIKRRQVFHHHIFPLLKFV